jgi:hypothetical protein
VDITEQLLTPEQIKRGFTLEEQTDDFVILSLKGKELAHFSQKGVTKKSIQNVANTLWEIYTLGFKDGQRLTHGDKLFDTISKDII